MSKIQSSEGSQSSKYLLIEHGSCLNQKWSKTGRKRSSDFSSHANLMWCAFQQLITMLDSMTMSLEVQEGFVIIFFPFLPSLLWTTCKLLVNLSNHNATIFLLNPSDKWMRTLTACDDGIKSVICLLVFHCLWTETPVGMIWKDLCYNHLKLWRIGKQKKSHGSHAMFNNQIVSLGRKQLQVWGKLMEQYSPVILQYLITRSFVRWARFIVILLDPTN